MLYEIQPTGPARRLATQQVGYDQKGKSAVQRRRLQQRRLQQHSQYHFLGGQQRMSLTSYPGFDGDIDLPGVPKGPTI